MVLEKTLESPLDYKEIQPVHLKGDHSWIFIGRTDVKAHTPILCPPDVKSWLIWKEPDAGKDWGQEEKWTTEDEMVGWHHWLNGHGFWWTLGVGDGQGGLVCWGTWGCKESDTTEWLNDSSVQWCLKQQVCAHNEWMNQFSSVEWVSELMNYIQCSGNQIARHHLEGDWERWSFIYSLLGEGWRRQWHPTPVLLPGKLHGWRSLVGYSPQGHRESDTTKQLTLFFTLLTCMHSCRIYRFGWDYISFIFTYMI